jgi:alpha-L-rhamnosidase
MNRLLAATVFAAVYVPLAWADEGPKAPDHLTVERLADPVGIESRAPRFGWWLGEGFVRQKKYRILVASSLEKLEANEGDLWDSGVVQSDDSVDVSYAGVPLGDSRRAWWKVQVSEWHGGGLVVSP